MEQRRPTPNLERAPLVEWRARQITDPVERLRYLRQTMDENPSPSGGVPPPAASWLRLHLRSVAVAAALALALGAGVRVLRGSRSEGGSASASIVAAPLRDQAPRATRYADTPAPKVWRVEQHDEYEIYSNGLRVENAYRTGTQTRRYPRFKREEANGAVADWQQTPAGLVFHTTEGQLAPFEAAQNQRLIKLGAGLLSYIKRAQAYHFVIDRFGRVFRVVQESDVAYHAGHSLWDDDKWSYVGLNQSFLGVAFESRTDPAEPIATAAQLRSGRTLTEMLRSQYAIPARNCVTHAQVSVNDSNGLIGSHTDWAGNFPFAELGLPQNYDLPLPSLYTFGFGYDSFFVKATGSRPWRGLQEAEERVRLDASRKGLPVLEYRNLLRERYKKLVQTVKNSNVGEEKGDDRSE